MWWNRSKSFVFAALILGAMACTEHNPDTMASETCDKLLECDVISTDERGGCVDNEAAHYREHRDQYGDDCWTAYLELHNCRMGLECEVLRQRRTSEECGGAMDAVSEACSEQ